jgi:predicted ATP-dependent protease
MTGEIDLLGNVTAIGGVQSKLFGGKKAGCTLALIPQENWEDFEILKREGNSPEDDTFRVKPISHIKELIKYAII